MGNFNEIQKGIPHLDNNYWQDFKKGETEENEAGIVSLNCQTIFNPAELSKNIKINPSIFKE